MGHILSIGINADMGKTHLSVNKILLCVCREIDSQSNDFECVYYNLVGSI